MVIVLILVLLFGLFIIIDAWIVAAKKKVTALKSYNKLYVYLIYALITGLISNLLFLEGGKLITNTVGVKSYSIPTASMEPTLLIGDYIFADKHYYKRNEPQRGDLALLQPPQDSRQPHLKRIIATEGDKIEIHNKQVFINDRLINEDYIIHSDSQIFTEDTHYDYTRILRDNFGPKIVPENHCFVMGDNRDISRDSRFWGFLPLKNIKGKPLFVYFSSQLKSEAYLEPSFDLGRLIRTLINIRAERIGLDID
jgi:signal peptidase I